MNALRNTPVIVKHRLLADKPYKFQPYPSVRYHPDGSTITVSSVEEDKKLDKVWVDTPYPAAPPQAAKREPTLEELKPAFAELLKAHSELRKEHTALLAHCSKLNTELEALRAAPVPAEKKLPAKPVKKPASAE